jgi:hypothetical protein
LAVLLRLDKSNTSRQIARLESSGFVERRVSDGDARSSELYLTVAGKQLWKKIDRFASSQVSSALQRLSHSDQKELMRVLGLYAESLGQDNVADTATKGLCAPSITEGYQPGCIGDVTSLHAVGNEGG